MATDTIENVPASQKKRRRAGRNHTSPEKVKIFISYASEDKDLVNELYSLLQETFQFAPLSIFLDQHILGGENWATKIDSALDESDILLVLFTEQKKSSHSYTGYEVGYFSNSMKQRPKSTAGFDRIYIPFCIGADIPAAMHYIQGVSIGKDQVYKVLKTRIEDGAEPNLDTDHPIMKFLMRIADLIREVTSQLGDHVTAPNLTRSANALYLAIHKYLQSRVSSETFPERKLIIRTDTKPCIEQNTADLTNGRVELVGDFGEVLGITPASSAGIEFGWSTFCERIPPELRASTVLGIQHLVAAIVTGIGDNYHLITTTRRDKSYRLFVSKVVTFVSQKTEIHVYMVQIRAKEYGDPLTTRLLKAISAGLRFRFLLLEEQSEFRAEKLNFPTITPSELKTKIVEMLAQIDSIMREAGEADLKDPDLCIMIWGKGQEQKLEGMMKVFDAVREKLNLAAQAMLDSANDEELVRRKGSFIAALEEFCGSVEEMNCDYTSRVLSVLADKTKERLVPPKAPTHPLAMGVSGPAQVEASVASQLDETFATM